MTYTRDKNFLLTAYFLFYFTVFLFFFLDHRLLSQVQPVFFDYNRDITELALIATGLPRFMIAHPVSLGVADGLALLLPLLLIAYAFYKRRFSVWLGIGFSGFLALYLLLADLFWQLHHEPFVLYLLLSLAFITNRERNFYRVLAGCRYYFLYIFISAALWKLFRGAVFNPNEMSRILLLQHSDLLSGDCSGWVCRTYSWLIDHPGAAQWLYVGGAVVEASFLIGFFTRRYDRLLLLLAFVFVVADLLVMRIPYWTLLLGGVTLWLDTGRRERAMVIYETTHHENLPALLDLSEARFGRVIVFLRESSMRNLTGKENPAERWPSTVFIVQNALCSNRAFIRRMFALIKECRYSHLHLSTLDNNLLYFSLRLCMAGNLRVSLTLHEVNAWFAWPLRSLRDWSESMAKLALHRQIQHYSVFLPAMAAALRRRMPYASAVFIPSRFYEQQPGVRGSGDDPFTIVIPGTVDPNRRDYGFVADFFEGWLGRALPPARRVKLVMLGDSRSPYGAEIVARLQALVSDRFVVSAFTDGYIPEVQYEQELSGAHLLWSPLQLCKKGSRENPEVYGETTASGLTADLLLNNTPALLPAALALPDVFRPALLPYASAKDLSVILDRLLTDTAWLPQLRREIDAAFSFFRKENFYADFDLLTGEKKKEEMP